MTADEVEMKMSIEVERLAELFAYDPESGVVSWRVDSGRWGHFKAGTQAGWSDERGYRIIAAGRQKVFSHRVAWALHYGKWPKEDIDHINGDKSDNRISNLRDVSRTVNKQNQSRAHRNSTTGILGVSPYRGGYRARIVVFGKERQIGTFATTEAAKAAYLTAKRQLHEGCTL